MAFKDDASFLRFVTMGAVGARLAKRSLSALGHNIIELERNCCSNKIWRTKIKRLRLPDLMCTRCGQRYEVRAKSQLEIKMSHSPENPERHWDSGMGDDDIVLFIGMPDGEAAPEPHLNAFRVAELRQSQGAAREGQRKSASEGAELDLTWPSWTPKSPGVVEEVELGPQAKLKVLYDEGRRYTYSARDKLVLVEVDARFGAGDRILAAVVSGVDLAQCPGETWEPDLTSDDAANLYAGVKAIRYRNAAQSMTALQAALERTDRRIVLEAAGSLAALGEQRGVDMLLRQAMSGEADDAPWAMEAAFILAEVGTPLALAALRAVAEGAPLIEVRSAAVWGLRGTSELLAVAPRVLTDAEPEVREHAVVALASSEHGGNLTARMLELTRQNADIAAGATEVLRLAAAVAVDALLAAAAGNAESSKWAFAALAGRAPEAIRAAAAWNDTPESVRSALELAWFIDLCADSDTMSHRGIPG